MIKRLYSPSTVTSYESGYRCSMPISWRNGVYFGVEHGPRIYKRGIEAQDLHDLTENGVMLELRLYSMVDESKSMCCNQVRQAKKLIAQFLFLFIYFFFLRTLTWLKISCLHSLSTEYNVCCLNELKTDRSSFPALKFERTWTQ